MKSAIRPLKNQIVTRLRLPRILHTALWRKQITIVMYHAVIRAPLVIDDWCFTDEASFRTQVSYLKNNFEVIPLSEAVEKINKRRIRRPAVVITLDDGYLSNYEVAFPILREAGLPATIFVTTGLVDTDDMLWPCRLHQAIAKTSKSFLEWDGCSFNLSGLKHKVASLGAIRSRLKEFAQPQLLAKLRNIILELGADPDCPAEADSPFHMLSRVAIADMLASGLIEFGAHSHTHAILSLLSPEERFEEIERSVVAIGELTGRPCELFAYPNGRAQDYDAETIKTLRACGVRASVTSIAGANNETTPVMELKRYGIGANLSMADFQSQVHHLSKR